MLIQTLPFAPVIAIRSLHAAMHVKASALHAEVLDFMPHACNLVPDSFFAAIHATIYVVLFVHSKQMVTRRRILKGHVEIGHQSWMVDEVLLVVHDC